VTNESRFAFLSDRKYRIKPAHRVPHLGAGRPLGYIYDFCKHHKLPLLNTLAISEDTGKPGAPSETDFDLSTEKARVFVFDWLSHGAPSKQDFEAAQAAEQASVAQAAGLTA
jgi:hypothetical protein